MGDQMDIVKVIAACAKYGVKKLKYGDIEVDFSGATMGFKEWPKVKPLPKEQEIKEQPIEPSREEMNEQMLLEDPMAFEKMMLEG